MKTLKDAQRFDDIVELFLHPPSGEFDVIGHLTRRGKRIYYAYVDGVYYEAPTRLRVAQKLATKFITK